MIGLEISPSPITTENIEQTTNSIHNFLELVKMSTLEEKLEAIEIKVMKLVEQNLQFKEICEDLLSARRQLEKENVALKEKLAQQTNRTQEMVPSNLPRPNAGSQQLVDTYAADKEEIKQQIDQYIQAIDNSIEWLRAL